MTEEDSLKQAKMYFIINRCSFSGATLSGGFSSEASTTRFTEASIDSISKLNLNDIEFMNTDFVEFFDNEDNKAILRGYKCFIFCDPPYMLDAKKNKLYGVSGDLHESFDHQKFHDIITSLNRKNDVRWLITYNDSPEIRSMYKDYTIISASWAYGMNTTKKSSEIIILDRKINKGSVPHLTGSLFEMEIQEYFIKKGFEVSPKLGNTSTDPDVIVKNSDGKECIVECKTKLKGTDYKETKLTFADGKYTCECANEYLRELVNKYMPSDLFSNTELPKNISSKDWNSMKLPTFKDVYVIPTGVDISKIIPAMYLFIKDKGIFRTTSEDPLKLDVPMFDFSFKLRYYVKNHSSSSAKKCNISAVATLRIC